MHTATEAESKINGIDVAGLKAVATHVNDHPSAAQTTWCVTSRWRGGTRSDHHVDSCMLGGQKIKRDFKIQVDEPTELLGTNQYANPQEYLLAATNACMMVGFAAAAAMMGVRLSKLELELTGDIDLRGFLDIDRSVPPGYRRLYSRVKIAGDGTREQFEKMHELVKRTSPNYYNMTQPVEIRSELVVE